MSSYISWLLLLAITVISVLDAKEQESSKREPRFFFNVEDLISPVRLYNLESTPQRVYHNYQRPSYHSYKPSSVYATPYHPISHFLKKIFHWKTKPLYKPHYKPYYKPYIYQKPTTTTTTTTTTTPVSVVAQVLACECGIRKPGRKIVGGEEANPNEYPWMAAFCRNSDCSKDNQFCGGSLICEDYILSAAHCFTSDAGQLDVDLTTTVVALGAHDLDDAAANFIEYQIENIIIHPDYQPDTELNDIALIKLMSKPTLSDNVNPICLPKNDDNTYAGDIAVVSGWGDTEFEGDNSNVLLDVNVAVFNEDACRALVGQLPPSQLCAGGMGEDSCQGDSGGPLISALDIERNKYELIGLVSFVRGCANTPGVYTRVTSYLEWIEKNTKGSLKCRS